MKYIFSLKKAGELTSQEKEELMQFMIKIYPAFKKYYVKNKYYSTVRPQMVHIIKNNETIIGTGKLLHRKIRAGAKSISLFAFGVLIAKKHRGEGLGTQLIVKNIVEAKKRKADILYGSTKNPRAEKIVKKLGFKKVGVPVYYTDTKTKRIIKEKNRVWIFEFKKGFKSKLEGLEKLYIGTGPL